MKILFTGASSFSGLWFVKALAQRGHEVTALLHKEKSQYREMRQLRVEQLKHYATLLYAAPFGSDLCLKTIKEDGPWDLFCHHAADVSNYKNFDFDFVAALASNTLNIKNVCEQLVAQNCHKILLTGSLFEQREGFNQESTAAVSPYGLSKGMTSDVFDYFSNLCHMRLSKFVIPNPYGPYEEMRFTSYLAKTWIQGKSADVNSPDYIRDNIPISLLAKSYAIFAEKTSINISKICPSFRPESQGSFVRTFAHEMSHRLQLPCKFILHPQTTFTEPKVRINNDLIDITVLDWNEELAWDELADFYQKTYSEGFLL